MRSRRAAKLLSLQLAVAVAVAVTVPPSVARADGVPFDAEAAEARAQMRASLASMEGTSSHLRAVLRDARKTRDTGKIACADEALSRVDVSLRQAKQHTAAALEAFARSDVGEARREMRVVSALRDAVKDAGVLGDVCATRPTFDFPAQRDTTVVRVYVDPRLPEP
jgi:hypothetical protein